MEVRRCGLPKHNNECPAFTIKSNTSSKGECAVTLVRKCVMIIKLMLMSDMLRAL